MGAAWPSTNVSGLVADSLGMDKNLCRQAYEDGSEYYGQFRKRQFHGRGRMRWNVGGGQMDEYEGFWVEGKMHGQGVYKYYDGTRYQGQFRENVREGYGILTFADGSLYEGSWSEDVPEGDGRVIYSNGEILNTTFQAGQQSMERLESLVREAVPPPPPEALDFTPSKKKAESPVPALLEPPPLPAEPYPAASMALALPDASMTLGDARLPVLALTHLPNMPPPLATAPLPSTQASPRARLALTLP
ncbi:unnamed protein product [Effrenium voratum]|nr:unnamed protein product [Effrenium voratum]